MPSSHGTVLQRDLKKNTVKKTCVKIQLKYCSSEGSDGTGMQLEHYTARHKEAPFIKT
jgi:hypothetical protein